MNLLSLNKNRLAATGIFIFLLLFCSSCANNQEFIKYTSDQINVLKKTTAALEESTSNTSKRIDTINSSQAAILVELEALKNDIRELTGRVEDNENLIKHNLEKDLGEQGDTKTELGRVAEKLDRLEKMVTYHHQYLNLEPFIYKNSKTDTAGKVNTDSEVDTSTPVNDADTTTPNSVQGDEKPEDVLYKSSLAMYYDQKYDEAIVSFKSFLDTYPKSDLADNAQFWIGECFMGLKQYDSAYLAFQDCIKKYPNGNKVPRAMYRQAGAMLQKGETTGARIVLKDLIKKYPNSPDATDAEKKLSSIK